MWTKDLGSRAETSTVRTVNGVLGPFSFLALQIQLVSLKGRCMLKQLGLDSMSFFLAELSVKMVKWASILLLKICRLGRIILLSTIRWNGICRKNEWARAAGVMTLAM